MTGEESSPDFAAVLQASLAEAKVENGFYQIPVTVHSDTITRLQITLEIEYEIEASVMPQGLNEVLLPYDFSSLPKAQENVLQLAVPANMRVAPNGVTAQVRGAFEDSRVVYGPTGAVTPAGTAEISPAISQAQIILPPETLKAMAFDLFMMVTQTVKLQLDLREDLDGKPGDVSLLPGVVKFELLAPVGTAQDGKTASQPHWVSVALPTEFQFRKGQRYWLVLQSLEGQTAWNATPALAGIVEMQHKKDGGLSWRDTIVTGISGAASAIFRLRQKPERFEIPIELQVGAGEQAIRVNLDRFQPLGRVDFALDFDEIAKAFNQYLTKVAPATCPETEHLANGDFEQWLRVGEKLRMPTVIPLLQGVSPTVVAISVDGRLAYVGSDDLMQLVDGACNTVLDEPFGISGVPNALVFHPAGGRAYLLGFNRLQVIDTDTHTTLGGTLSLKSGANSLAVSPDGGRLYVTEYYYITGYNEGFIRAIDTLKLEQAVIKGAPKLEDVTTVAIGNPIPLGQQQEPTALAVAPDGDRLYVTIVKHGAGESGEVRIFETATLQQLGAAIPAGQEPRAIALTPDGKWAVVANKGSNNVSIIDTVRGTAVGSAIPVGTEPVAVVVSPDGAKAYVANSGSDSISDNISIIDLVSKRSAGTIDVNASQTAIALTLQGDRIYVITTDGDNNSLAFIQIGARLPAEWNLTAGRVTPFCLPDPFHLIAVLGELSDLRQKGANPSPSVLSQTVPVAESCPYDFSFWGIATESDAVAEVMWISKDCGLIQTDRVPIQVLERQAAKIKPEAFTRAVGVAAHRPQLVLHRVRLMAQAGAQQAEIRFNVPEGVVAGIDRVSLSATTESMANADLTLRQEGQLAGWNLLSTAVSGVTVVAVEGGIQLRNAGAETAELVQTIPAKGDQPFRLEFRGRALIRPSVKDKPSIELRWLKADQSLVGSPTVLQVLRTGVDSMLASGTSPAGAAEAEIRLAVPSGTTLEIKQVSLRFSTATPVPVTFIAQAPGELTVSNWRVRFEQIEAAPPRIPEKGLCAPTPPGRQPSETPHDCCFCPCCESERTMAEITSMETGAERPVSVGRCSTCGTDLVRFGGKRVPGAQLFHPGGRGVSRAIVFHPILSRVVTPIKVKERSKIEAPAPTPLTAIVGIGEDAPGNWRRLALTRSKSWQLRRQRTWRGH
ncbi:MAG: YncE family protein [Candidatus Methylomirabilis sp.]|nr:YncE family protein [Candidatus Methylomirabilis sp.]